MKWFLITALLLVASHGAAQEVVNADTIPRRSGIKHSSKGFIFTTADGNYELQLAARLQFRFSSPFDQDPVTNDDFATEDQTTLKVNRARLKIGGHAYAPWLKYYFEYELGQSNLLDFKVMVERYKGLCVKVGQWKTDHNRERMISSGEQQTVERSLINRPFTLDRQQGVEVYGQLAGRGLANFHYWVSALTGMGRGARANDDTHLMYAARVQWNPLGRAVDLSGSDWKRSERAALSIAAAGVTNRSPYTRFSQAGGGQLEGYTNTAPGQFDVQQVMLETAFTYRGFSWQHETHWKRIDDRVSDLTTHLFGMYVQSGYFFHERFPGIPKELELAVRYAMYRPDVDVPGNVENEYVAAVNWFFEAGHKNKLTAEVSYISFEQDHVPYNHGGRVRLQWDISF